MGRTIGIILVAIGIIGCLILTALMASYVMDDQLSTSAAILGFALGAAAVPGGDAAPEDRPTVVADAQTAGEYKLRFDDVGTYDVHVAWQGGSQDIEVTRESDGGLTIHYAPGDGEALRAPTAVTENITAVSLVMSEHGEV